MCRPAARGDLLGLAVELDLHRFVVEVLDDATAVGKEIKPGLSGGAKIHPQRLEQGGAQRIELTLAQLEQRLGLTLDRENLNVRRFRINLVAQGLGQPIGQ